MAEDSGSRQNGSPPNQNQNQNQGQGQSQGQGQPRGCTQAQLRRFIKSRAYVPMHELRRRFTIDGEADDVRAVKTRDGRYWAGLPERECGFLAELVDRGEVGVELCHDPSVDMIIGVFAIRPVGR